MELPAPQRYSRETFFITPWIGKIKPYPFDAYEAIKPLMAQVRHKLIELYKQPLANDDRAHAIDEVLRYYSE